MAAVTQGGPSGQTDFEVLVLGRDLSSMGRTGAMVRARKCARRRGARARPLVRAPFTSLTEMSGHCALRNGPGGGAAPLRARVRACGACVRVRGGGKG